MSADGDIIRNELKHVGISKPASVALVRLEAAERERDRFQRRVVAHHDIATLSDEVLREYNYRSCPVCVRADAEEQP